VSSASRRDFSAGTAEVTQALTEKGWTKTDANPDALVLLRGGITLRFE
jgi:hypothetical protein